MQSDREVQAARRWEPHDWKHGSTSEEAAYVCNSCGEEIVAPVDSSVGAVQEYVEDCPICCRPNVLTITVGARGAVRCEARPE